MAVVRLRISRVRRSPAHLSCSSARAGWRVCPGRVSPPPCMLRARTEPPVPPPPPLCGAAEHSRCWLQWACPFSMALRRRAVTAASRRADMRPLRAHSPVPSAHRQPRCSQSCLDTSHIFVPPSCTACMPRPQVSEASRPVNARAAAPDDAALAVACLAAPRLVRKHRAGATNTDATGGAGCCSVSLAPCAVPDARAVVAVLHGGGVKRDGPRGVLQHGWFP